MYLVGWWCADDVLFWWSVWVGTLRAAGGLNQGDGFDQNCILGGRADGTVQVMPVNSLRGGLWDHVGLDLVRATWNGAPWVHV